MALVQYPEQSFIFISFIHKTHALSSLFSDCLVESLRVFMSHNSVEFHQTFHFCVY